MGLMGNKSDQNIFVNEKLRFLKIFLDIISLVKTVVIYDFCEYYPLKKNAYWNNIRSQN